MWFVYADQFRKLRGYCDPSFKKVCLMDKDADSEVLLDTKLAVLGTA